MVCRYDYKRGQGGQGLIKVEKPINLAEKMLAWDVLFQTELIKQCVLLNR